MENLFQWGGGMWGGIGLAVRLAPLNTLRGENKEARVTALLL